MGRAFAEFVQQIAAAAGAKASPLYERIREHLGTDFAELPVTVEQFDTFEQPNLQVALSAYLAGSQHQAELIGVSMPSKRYMAVGLSELATWGRGGLQPELNEGPVDFVNFHLSDGEVLSCVQFGLYLVRSGEARLAALVTGPSEMGDPRLQKLRLEVMAVRTDDARDFIAEIRRLMISLNVYRGHTLTLSSAQLTMGPGPTTLVQFQPVPGVLREDVVLPAGLLDQIDRHTVVFSRHAEELRASGRALKRGLLLYGLPGTGKTLSVMYLIGQLPGRTVVITTGRGLGLIQTVVQLARALAPSMVVLEDVDLVAEERTMPGFGARPVLFELLNEMDGLADDVDIIFVLTTNRPDILEPALAARPGRIDLAVELPLPDAAERAALLELYARGLTLVEVDLASIVDRISGATPAYIKELMRKAALRSLESGDGMRVSATHIEGALDELAQGGRLAERILGFRPDPSEGQGTVKEPPGMPPTGFPWVGQMRRGS